MEIKNFLPQVSIDLSELVTQLKQETHIQEVINKFNLSNEMLENNVNVLYQYHLLKTQASNLEGYEVSLTLNNDILFLEYQMSEENQKYHKQMAFTKNYWINHLPEKLLLIDNKSINFDYYTDLAPLIDLYSNTPESMTKGLYIYGEIGIGKTYLLAAYANQLAKQGYSVCFVSMSRLLSEIKQSFNNKNDELYESIMRKLINCDFLVLDDIGSEAVTQWSRDEILFTVLNERMESQRLTCFSSNLSKELLKEFYLSAGYIEDEIKLDRLMERFEVLSSFFNLVSKTKSLRKTQ